jgi:O-antigen ligase
VKRSAEPIVTIRLNYFGFTGRFLFLLNAFFVLSALHAEDTVETFARGVPLLLFTLFLVTLNDYFRARRRVVVFVRNFCLLGGVLAALGIVQWIIVRKQLFLFLQPYVVPQSWHDIGLKIGWKTSDLGQFKSSAIFQHQNIYGAYLASVAPLFLSLFFFHRKISLKLFYGTLFAAASLALLLSSSRGGLLNYLAGCGVLLLYVRPRHLWKFVLAGAAGFSALVYVYLDKILMLLRLQSGLSGRGQIWNYSLRMIEQSPWFGVGFLNIGDEFYSRFGPAYIVDMQLFFDKIMYTTKEIDFFGFHAHSLYLNLAVEMGVFAAVAAFVFYIVMIVRTFRFIASEKLQRWENSMAIAVMSILCGSFVHSFFDTNTLHYILIHIAVLMAIERMYIVRLVDQDFQKASLQN